MKVYLDVFFLVNALMNYLMLTLLGMIRRRKPGIFRLLFASLVGGLAGVLFFIFGLGRFTGIYLILYGFVSGILIVSAFGKKTLMEFMADILLYYVLSFLAGGILTALSGPYGNRPISIWKLMFVAAILLTIARLSLPRLWQSCCKRRNQYKVRIGYHENEVMGTGLLDTGNQLIEPISKKPVAVVEYTFIQPLFEEDEQLFLQNYPMDEIPQSHMMVHYIPFSSVGNPKGCLLGVKVDWLKIEIDGKWQIADKPWIGICGTPISSKRDYEMLLHEGFFPSAI